MTNIDQAPRESAIAVVEQTQLDYWVNREARPILAKIRDWANRSFGGAIDVTAGTVIGPGVSRLRVDASAGPVTLVLRPSTEAVAGVRELVFKKIDTSPNAVYVDVHPETTDDIDGIATYVILSPYSGLRLMPRTNGYDIVG